jgi:putative spermidine/putrescine transport system permease protein
MSTSIETSTTLLTREDSETRKGHGFGLDKIMLIVVALYFLVPLLTTFIFAITDGSQFNLHGFSSILNDTDFGGTLLLSLELAIASTLLTVLLVTPTAYWVQLRLPRARVVMDILALVPFTVPAIVMAFGLIEVYSNDNGLIDVLSLGLVPLLRDTLNIVNTPPLLICAYVIIALPFVYRPIDNNLRAINTRVLSEAASSLGSGWWRTFLTVILPNIWPGVTSAALLTFSTAMGEFTLASLFGLYTFPIYLNVTTQNDAHKAAALTILSFLITLLCVLGIALLGRVHRVGGRTQRLDMIAAK